MASIKPGALHRFAPMVFGLSGTGVRLGAERVFAFGGMRNLYLVAALLRLWSN